jgi:hypothetical protein
LAANGNITTPYINGISSTTMSYLDPTSSVQTQLNNKQNVISGTSAVTCGNLTTSSLIDNGDLTCSGNVTVTKLLAANGNITAPYVNNISTAAMSFLDATSSIQTQINSKQATLTAGSVGDSLLTSTFVKPSTAPILTGTNFTGIPTSAISSGALTVTSLTCTSENDSGNALFGSIAEKLSAVTTNSTNNYTINYSTSGVAYLSTAPTANFTIALWNCPSSTTQSGVFTLVFANTGKYYPTTINVYSDGGSTAITCTAIWSGGTPSISSATVSILTIAIIKSLSSNYALCSLSSYY